MYISGPAAAGIKAATAPLVRSAATTTAKETTKEVVKSGVKKTAIQPSNLASATGEVAGKGGGNTGGGTEIVQRWMSTAELDATQSSGLLRGGRDGTHWVTDAANASTQRARQRLALPQTLEVTVTLEIPSATFSAPTRVLPRFNMPGGRMERTATVPVPLRILKVDGKP